MKNILLTLSILIFFSGCKKECPEWFEGENCQTEIRKKYFGNYEGKITTRNENTGQEAVVYDNFYINSSLDCVNCLSIDNEYYIQLTDNEKFIVPLQNMVNSTYVISDGEGAFFNNDEVFFVFKTSSPPSVSIYVSGKLK